jgi:hypothetical protein
MAGYSGTPLPKKLGIKPGHRLALVAAPDGFEASLRQVGLDGEVTVETLAEAPARVSAAQRHDVIVAFVTERAELAKSFGPLAAALDPAGGLWIAWPKKASGRATDVTEDVVRAIALAAGLVDNKVCAIDEVWSGLRCVVRLADRPKKKAAGQKAGRAKGAAG